MHLARAAPRKPRGTVENPGLKQRIGRARGKAGSRSAFRGMGSRCGPSAEPAGKCRVGAGEAERKVLVIPCLFSSRPMPTMTLLKRRMGRARARWGESTGWDCMGLPRRGRAPPHRRAWWKEAAWGSLPDVEHRRIAAGRSAIPRRCTPRWPGAALTPKSAPSDRRRGLG